MASPSSRTVPDTPRDPDPGLPPSPSSQSMGQRAAAAARRNPVALAAGVGTGGIVSLTAAIEALKALQALGSSGIILQVSGLVIVLIWTAAAYAGLAARREDRAIGVIEQAVMKLEEGQAALTRTVEGLTRQAQALAHQVQAFYDAADEETARRLRLGKRPE